MATKIAPGRGPAEMTDGYSISGSQAKSVALKPGGTLRGGKRFSVSGPLFGGSWTAPSRTRLAKAQRIMLPLLPPASVFVREIVAPGGVSKGKENARHENRNHPGPRAL